MRNERSLHRMKISRLSEPLDGGDFIVLVHDGKAEARVHATAIDVHSAGSALAVVTALLCARQLRAFAQAIQQSGARIDLEAEQLAVHTQSNWDGIGNLPLIRICNLLSRRSLCGGYQRIRRCSHPARA